MKVRDVMSSPAVWVSTDTPARHLAEIMAEHGFSGLPVVDELGNVLGVVSEADLVAKAGRTRPGRRPKRVAGAGRRGEPHAEGVVAGELMTSPAFTVAPDDDLRVAARRLSQHGVKRLPVTVDGKLVGIVTRLDVLKSFLRSDEEIRRDIEENVLGRNILDIRHDVTAQVANGVVTLLGTCARRSTAELIRHDVDRIDGVTKVIDGVLYGVDDAEPVLVSAPLGRLEFHL